MGMMGEFWLVLGAVALFLGLLMFLDFLLSVMERIGLGWRGAAGAVLLLSFIVGYVVLANPVGAVTPTDESTLRARILACVIIDGAREHGIPERRLPVTLASCRALR